MRDRKKIALFVVVPLLIIVAFTGSCSRFGKSSGGADTLGEIPPDIPPEMTADMPGDVPGDMPADMAGDVPPEPGAAGPDVGAPSPMPADMAGDMPPEPAGPEGPDMAGDMPPDMAGEPSEPGAAATAPADPDALTLCRWYDRSSLLAAYRHDQELMIQKILELSEIQLQPPLLMNARELVGDQKIVEEMSAPAAAERESVLTLLEQGREFYRNAFDVCDRSYSERLAEYRKARARFEMVRRIWPDSDEAADAARWLARMRQP